MRRLRTWLVAAFGLGSLLLLIVVSLLTSSRKAQEIYVQLDQLNAHHQEVSAKLRRLRSDINLSGIFVRDYLLDVAREHAPEYRERLTEFRQTNKATVAELLVLDEPDAERIRNLETQLDEYWQTFEPLFDWTVTEKIFRSASFLRREVVPRREAILAIAQEIEELNNTNLAAQRAEVTRRQAAFRDDLRRLLWQTVLLGIAVALIVVYRLRVLERRSEEQRAIAEDAERQMRQLSQERDAAQEEERKHLSRELHDHVAQVLTALRMELGRIERTRSPADTRIGAAVVECKKLVDSMFRTVRDLALGLRPSMLDDFGLQAALEWHVRDFISRYGANVELTIDGDFETLPDRYRTCVYRAVQEALTNCVRHAKAGCIRVSVTGKGNELKLSVTDDGVGFDSARRRIGLGLRGIEERVKELHGTMTIGNAEGGGTTLAIRVPWPAHAEAPLARAAG
ncbi:MAG TPA: ATP-binding protein [Vicinamibacterales bacterium]|nr:ATP-binding protein [Vicinamibacterales bacterium]